MEPPIKILNNCITSNIKRVLKENGVVMIRNNSHTIKDFEELSETLIMPMVHHATNTVERDPVNKDRTTSTVNNGMDAIPYHREGS